MLHTTFNRLKLAGACGQKQSFGEGYDKLATHLRGTTSYGTDTLIPLDVVVESNGLPDALWCLRATTEDFATVVHPFICGYLADILEHLALRTSAKTKSLLVTVALLRSPVVADAVADAVTQAASATTYYATAEAASASAAVRAVRAAYAAYAVAIATDTADAAEAAATAAYYSAHAADDASVDDAVAAHRAAFDAERKWQTEQFLSLLRGG